MDGFAGINESGPAANRLMRRGFLEEPGNESWPGNA